MDVNSIFNDVYERAVAYYKNNKTMIKSEVGKKDTKFKEFWIERTIDNYFFTNIKVSVTQDEIIVDSLCEAVHGLKICIKALEWPGFTDKKKTWLLSYALKQGERLLLEYYALLYSEVRRRYISSYDEISRWDITAYFASTDRLVYVTDPVSGTGVDSEFFIYLDNSGKLLKTKLTFSQTDVDLVATTDKGKVLKVPLGTSLEIVMPHVFSSVNKKSE